MTPLVYLLYSIHTLMIQPVPAGTALQLRMANAVG